MEIGLYGGRSTVKLGSGLGNTHSLDQVLVRGKQLIGYHVAIHIRS
jgi:hypothetical protein